MKPVKKNDIVIVRTGKEKGKQGTVIKVLPKKGRVFVKGIALVKRHTKARRQGEVSGIKEHEASIDLSNVMPVCSACKKPCRVNTRVLENGRRARTCNRCKEIF